MQTNSALFEWQNFYVIVGSASAALIGLQFIVMALVADMRKNTSHATISAFGTPTVVHFTGGMITAAVMSAPWPSMIAVSFAVMFCAVAGFGYAIYATHRAHRQTDYKTMPEDWFWYVILPSVIYAALAIAAVTLPNHVAPALFVIGAVSLALLLIGIRNAWDTVTYIVTGGAQGNANEKAEAARKE